MTYNSNMKKMHTPFVKSAEHHVNANSRQMNKTFILSVVSGIIALIVLIYINDMLFPILNAQLGLFIAATVMCAAIVVIFRQKSIQRRNGVFKRIKDKIIKKAEDHQDLLKNERILLTIVGATTVIVFCVMYLIYDYLIAGLQLSIGIFLTCKTVMWIPMNQTKTPSSTVINKDSKVSFWKKYWIQSTIFNKRMLYAGIGLIFTGVLYRSGIVFIILEFILHISVTMVTAGLMVWWINSVSENQIPGKYRTTKGGADIQEDAEAANGLQGKRNLKVLIEKINFQTFYPDELNLSDVMSRTYKDKCLTLQGVFFDFVRNLLFLNHECRDRILHDKMENMIERGILFERGNFWNYIFGCNVTQNKITLNPLDLIITLFVCSSPKLKQVLTEKLFACRLAFPFSIPFSDNGSLQVQLWPLRSIFLECTIENHLFSINSADCPCVVVSFIRLGRPSFSKSHLINSLLFNQHNDLFYNKDCPLSEQRRYIGEGTIEATWMSSDFLSEKTLMLNLRGDGMNWEEQRLLVSKISTVIVVAVSLNDFKKGQFQFIIKNLYKSNAAIHLVIDPDDADRQKVNEQTELHLKSMGEYCKTKIILLPEKEKQRSHFKCEIKKNLQQSVNAVGTTESLTSRVQRCKVNIDEQHIDFRTAKDFAVKMMDVINSSNHKDHCLPLQTKPWRVLSQKLKTVNKSSLCPTLQEKGKLRQEIIVERQQQLDSCEKQGPLMTRFIKSLTDLLPSDIQCGLFISWLKIILAERTGKILCKSKQKHTTDLRALENALNKNVDESVLKLLQHEKYQIDNRCSDEIIGIEHLLREMGQMYEAVIECEARKDNLQVYLDVLPTIAAKLFILGEPFELLDGEVMNVPLIWIKAVLKKVTDILGDKRLLTVTVLGKTGTGKSSLLNTLFGSQFPVHDGIHTKGAFMQLIPVNSQTKKFDFILVLDTEGIHGIQAPDSNQKRKINEIELTTFVIGLSDAILVSMGEGRIAEQKNALEIVVQSLLKVKLAGKKLNLKQICHFVLQEFSDHVDMKRERMNLQNALDDVSKDIICQEKAVDLNGFKDIIDFDCNKNVWFLPLMRNTNADVKPPNPLYGECVYSIRESICREVNETRESFLTITDTISRIEDLWNAILKDDFVLSFCSSLEQKAYDHMEGQYQLTSWNLEKYIMEFIVNKAKQKLVICKTRNDLDKAMQTIQIYLSDDVDKKESNLVDKMESFIEESSLKDIMNQWKIGIRERLTKDKNKYVTKADERIKKIKENVREKQKGCLERVCKEKIINEQIAEQAQQLQTEKITDTLLEEKFNQVWEQRIETLKSQGVKIKVLIKDQITTLLQQEFSSDAEFVGQLGLPNSETYGSYSQLVGTIDVSRISTRDHLIVVSESDFPPEKCRNQTVQVANHIFQKIDTKLAELGSADIQFDLTYVHEILVIVVSYIAEHNRHLNNTYKFDLLPKFQALIMIHVVNYATEFFSRRIKVPCTPHTDDYKTTAWCYFKNIAKGETEDVIASGFFNAAVVKVIEEQVSELLPMEAQGSVQGILSHGKQTLIKRILIDLAEKEDFIQYKAFIEDPYTFAEKWILDLTNRKMFEEYTDDESFYAQLAKKQISLILNELRNTVIKTTDERNAGMSKWIETFVTKNTECNILPLNKDIFVHVENRNVTNLQTFSHALTKEFVEMRRKLFSIFENDTAVSVKWITNPASEVLDKLWGCSELCVFCMEPCMYTSKDHVIEGKLHECVQHRPQGIGGFRHSFSNKMVVDFCSHLVSGDQSYIHTTVEGMYKDYKENFPDWEIPASSDTSKYWIWVMCKFKNELAEMYLMELPDIPEHWTSYTKETAIDSL